MQSATALMLRGIQSLVSLGTCLLNTESYVHNYQSHNALFTSHWSLQRSDGVYSRAIHFAARAIYILGSISWRQRGFTQRRVEVQAQHVIHIDSCPYLKISEPFFFGHPCRARTLLSRKSQLRHELCFTASADGENNAAWGTQSRNSLEMVAYVS